MEITYINNAIACIKIATDENPYINNEVIKAAKHIVSVVNNNTSLKAIIITGTTKYFSMGAQREVLISAITQGELSNYIPELINLLTSIQVPMIAAMEGHAVGGGLAIGLWCDIAVFAEESLYGVNFMSLGFTPGMGSTILLEDSFGRLLAQEMLYTGKLLKGHELKAAGVPFAQHILPKVHVLNRAQDLTHEIAENPRDALVLLKQNLTARRMEKYQLYLQQEQLMHREILYKETTLASIKANYIPN